jgi:hypothetical protein
MRCGACGRALRAPATDAAVVSSKTERMMRRYAAVTDATLGAAAEAVAGSEPWPARERPAALADAAR